MGVVAYCRALSQYLPEETPENPVSGQPAIRLVAEMGTSLIQIYCVRAILSSSGRLNFYDRGAAFPKHWRLQQMKNHLTSFSFNGHANQSHSERRSLGAYDNIFLVKMFEITSNELVGNLEICAPNLVLLVQRRQRSYTVFSWYGGKKRMKVET